MAALIRLQMQPKQMSALLGISTNSVYKTKQRLRHRFNLETDWHVEEFLTSL
jgi:DNA-binding CsgD family transcriptional regulator